MAAPSAAAVFVILGLTFIIGASSTPVATSLPTPRTQRPWKRSAGTCSNNEQCSAGRCCDFGYGYILFPPPPDPNRVGVCRNLSRTGERCPANGHKEVACQCDSANVCRVPIMGIKAITGTCQAKHQEMAGGRCLTNRNCDYDSCCVINPVSKNGVQVDRKSGDTSDHYGYCQPLGSYQNKCESKGWWKADGKHFGACPCREHHRCLGSVAEEFGQCSMGMYPPSIGK